MTIAAKPDRSVFYGFAGWVGRVTSATECAFWPEDPNNPTIVWNQHKLIGVNLGRNPCAHRANQIQRDQIEVDDHPLLGGNTHLGPTFPTGKMMGPVFLESRFWDRLKPHGNQPPRAPTGGQCFDYELTTVLYWSGILAPRRFWGFHAEITSVRGTMGLATIWHGGRSQVPGMKPAGSFWIDVTQAHPIESGITSVGVGPNEPRKGALFLDTTMVANLALEPGKHPWYQGWI